jgi:hypothetical protein
MLTLQDWISQSLANLDVAAPVKARLCETLRCEAGDEPKLMRRGVERC